MIEGISQLNKQSSFSQARSPGMIGQYRVAKTLGQGSYGKVKLGIDDVSKQKVAIKIFEKNALNPKLISKLNQEIRSMRRLTHPNIVQLYDVIEMEDQIYFILEYCASGEFFDLIQRYEKLEESNAKTYFTKLISALRYCHTQGVAHRDLKPENILLDSNDEIKIADFGLSNALKDGVPLLTSCGSPNYAAPEVISGEAYDGTAADVWSCGVILYAALTNTLPFESDSISNLFIQIRKGDFYMPPHLSEDAQDLINRMLQVNPVKRINTKELLEHPWLLPKTQVPKYFLKQTVSAYQVSRLKSIRENFVHPRHPTEKNHKKFKEVKTLSTLSTEISESTQSICITSLYDQKVADDTPYKMKNFEKFQNSKMLNLIDDYESLPLHIKTYLRSQSNQYQLPLVVQEYLQEERQ